jgi:FkbM family methyltransferase
MQLRSRVRPLIPSRVRRVLARLLANNATARVTGPALRRRPVRSGSLHLDLSSPAVPPVVRLRVRLGLYEAAELRLVTRHLPARTDVVELGSSIGIVAAHVAQRLEPGRRLLCVEPDPILADVCELNLSVHAQHLDWRVLRAAVDYKELNGPTALFAARSDPVSGRLARPGESATEVPRLTLEDVVDGAGMDRFTLVMDIEGAEADVLAHGVRSLRRCDLVLTELHPSQEASPSRSVEELKEQLVGLGFFEVERDGGAYCYRRPNPPNLTLGS